MNNQPYNQTVERFTRHDCSLMYIFTIYVDIPDRAWARDPGRGPGPGPGAWAGGGMSWTRGLIALPGPGLVGAIL